MNMEDFELEKLRNEIQQEKQMKEMLEQSAAELRATVEELEKRYDTIDNEGNEWKTRFETQQEMNEQLERQILMLQNKVQEAKTNLKDAKAYVASRDLASRGSKTSQSELSSEETSKPGTAMTKSTGITINIAISPRGAGKTPRDLKNFDDLSDANPHMIRMLEKEKNVLHNQMRDLEWRLDQESKAYHKANDERKSYALEINTTKGVINELVTKQKATGSREHLETIPGSRTPRAMGNIPEDRRILDPKRGPIQKTAAVKNLPSLEST